MDIVHGRLDGQCLGAILRKHDHGLDFNDRKPAGIDQIDKHGSGSAPERVSTDKSGLSRFLQVERPPAVAAPSDNPPTNSPDRAYSTYPFGPRASGNPEDRVIRQNYSRSHRYHLGNQMPRSTGGSIFRRTCWPSVETSTSAMTLLTVGRTTPWSSGCSMSLRQSTSSIPVTPTPARSRNSGIQAPGPSRLIPGPS